MSKFTAARTYSSGKELKEGELDALKVSIESFFNNTGLNDDNIQNQSITASSKINEGSPIQTESFGAGSVITSKIQDNAVTSEKLKDLTISTTNINDGSVTRQKLVSSNYAIGPDVITGLHNGIVFSTRIYIGSVTIATSGRPVRIVYIPASTPSTTATDTGIYVDFSVASLFFALTKESGIYIGEHRIKVQGLEVAGNIMQIPTSTISFLDTPSAGTVTYNVDAFFDASNGTFSASGRLLAYEL